LTNRVTTGDRFWPDHTGWFDSRQRWQARFNSHKGCGHRQNSSSTYQPMSEPPVPRAGWWMVRTRHDTTWHHGRARGPV